MGIKETLSCHLEAKNNYMVAVAEPQDVLEEIESCADLEAAAASVGSGEGASFLLFDGPIRDRECAAVFSSVSGPSPAQGSC